MNDTLSIIKDILSKNNANIILDTKQKLTDLINCLKSDSKNKTIISILQYLVDSLNKIITNTNYTNEQLSIIMNKMKQTSNQNNNINSNIEHIEQLKNNNQNINYGKYYFDDAKYIGELRRGLPDGIGTCYFSNGDKYEGEWKNGKREGRGVYYFNSGICNGDRYEGEYRKGKREGKGAYYFKNGNCTIGNYLNDEPVGVHAKLTKDEEVKPSKPKYVPSNK